MRPTAAVVSPPSAGDSSPTTARRRIAVGYVGSFVSDFFPFCSFNLSAGYRFVQDLERQDQSAISLSQPGRSWQLGFGMFVMCCSKYTS